MVKFHKIMIWIAIPLWTFLFLYMTFVSPKYTVLWFIIYLSLLSIYIAVYYLSEVEQNNKWLIKRREIALRLLEILFGFMTAIFMFGAFLASFLLYINTATSDIVPAVYDCPKWIKTIESEETTVIITNLGGVKDFYQFIFLGTNNFLVWNEKNEKYVQQVATNKLAIGKSDIQQQKFIFKINNTKNENANYSIEWRGYTNLQNLMTVTCCYTQADDEYYMRISCK